MKHTSRSAKRSRVPQCLSKPWIEVLEDRLPPGDTLVGALLGALILGHPEAWLTRGSDRLDVALVGSQDQASNRNRSSAQAWPNATEQGGFSETLVSQATRNPKF